MALPSPMPQDNAENGIYIIVIYVIWEKNLQGLESWACTLMAAIVL